MLHYCKDRPQNIITFVKQNKSFNIPNNLWYNRYKSIQPIYLNGYTLIILLVFDPLIRNFSEIRLYCYTAKCIHI